jgi:hypothetical protein
MVGERDALPDAEQLEVLKVVLILADDVDHSVPPKPQHE